MRKLYADWRGTWHERPTLALLGIVYALVPFIVIGILIYSVFVQRPAIEKEARRNCQRSAAITTWIRTVTSLHPEGKGTADFLALLDLENKLRHIGSCPN